MNLRILPSCFLILLLLAYVPLGFGTSEAEARSVISKAEQDLTSAYNALALAEAAGAKGGDLKARLNDAGELLAQAHVAFRGGDYDSSISLANQCISLVEGIADGAMRLKADVEVAHNNNLFLTSALTSVALSVFYLASLLGWRFLKKRYTKRILGMKPEVRKTA